MKNNDDIAMNSTDYLERKIKREVRDKSYQVVHGSLDHLKEKRKIRVHRKHIDNIQKFDTEINSYNQDYNSQSNLDKKIDNNNHKINEINTDRNKYLDQREEMLNKNPNLHSSLNHLEGQHFDRSAATSNNYNTNSKEYKTSRQKKYNQSQMRSNIAKKENDYKFSNNERQYNITKEKDLDNDGIPDRIDIDDTRNSVQTTSDLFEVGNRTDKTHIKTQKNINQAKIYKNAYLKKEADKYQIGDKEDLSSLVEKENKVVVRKTTQKKINQKKMKANFSFENDPEVKDKKSSSKKTFSKDQEKKLRKNVQKKSMFGSPLTSQAVGKRTKTQKVLLAPAKAVSGAGASLKESLNKEIENSDMEGVKLANDIVSPLARKLRFESNSLIAKKVGFDRKAYNLSKVEKQIMKADKKAFKIKKAQRKNIRKKARINAKTVQGSKFDLVGRVRAITSQSATQIKDKVLSALKGILTAIRSTKVIAGASGLILLAVIPFPILAPLFMLGGGSALSSAEAQQMEFSFSASALSPDVMQWEDKVLEELRKYGLEQYKDLALVIIHLESRGTLPDVMQSSESIGLPPNTITDPYESIEVGIRHLNKGIQSMKKHNVDIQTLIQSYNYGTEFIPYVASKGGKWTQKLANDFSDMWASRLGWSSYGDKNYVPKAMEHLIISGDTVKIDVDFDLNGGQLANPVPNVNAISSPFGWRIHPIWGTRKLHTGIDIPAPFGTPIIAVADGVVIEAGWKGGYGNCVMIDHGSGVITLYAHNQKLLVHAGQKVRAGTQISEMGSTGDSTGSHLHFEVRHNGEYTDPMKWLK